MTPTQKNYEAHSIATVAVYLDQSRVGGILRENTNVKDKSVIAQ